MTCLKIGVGLAVALGVFACTGTGTIGQKTETVSGGACETPGATATATDGCNECSCSDDKTWNCTDMACGSEGCSYGGKQYAEGDTFPSTDGCNSCSCGGGQVACTDRACAPCQPGDTACGASCTEGGVEHPHGATWACSDGCNTCFCHDGQVSNTDVACGSSCSYNGRTYAPGEGFPSADGCNACYCEDGDAVCTTADCAGCSYGGRDYAHGETWQCDCNECACHDGSVSTTDVACTPCQPGTTKVADDLCNTCSCGENGQWSCTEKDCVFRACFTESECPALDVLCEECTDGSEACANNFCQAGTCVMLSPMCEAQACDDASDCPDLDSPCHECNGVRVCPAYQCVDGECVTAVPVCAFDVR